MKIKIFILTIILTLSISNIDSKERDITKEYAKKDEYYKYNNEKFHFTLQLPKNWVKNELDLSYKHVITLTNKNHAEITVSVTTADDIENEKWERWSEWYIEGAGTNLKIIFEKKSVKLASNYDSRLIVFQYNSQNGVVLKRIMINRYNNKLLVIECGSSIQSFYDYEKTFNMVMRSLELNL